MQKTAQDRLQNSAATDAAPEQAGEQAGTQSGAAELVMLDKSIYLDRLRAAVTTTYASLLADRSEAVGAIETTIAALARPEVPLDPAFRSELIGKLGTLLAKLEQLHAMLPRGERLALQSLDKAGALLDQMQQAED